MRCSDCPSSSSWQLAVSAVLQERVQHDKAAYRSVPSQYQFAMLLLDQLTPSCQQPCPLAAPNRVLLASEHLQPAREYTLETRLVDVWLKLTSSYCHGPGTLWVVMVMRRPLKLQPNLRSFDVVRRVSEAGANEHPTLGIPALSAKACNDHDLPLSVLNQDTAVIYSPTILCLRSCVIIAASWRVSIYSDNNDRIPGNSMMGLCSADRFLFLLEN